MTYAHAFAALVMIYLQRTWLPILAGVILGSLLTLAAFTLADPPAPALTDLRFAAPAGPALSTEHLTAKVAPIVQKHLIDAKADIVAHAGGLVERTAVRVGFPIAVREVPPVVEHGIDAVVDEFGQFSIRDLVKFLDGHAKAKGYASPRLLTELKAAQ